MYETLTLKQGITFKLSNAGHILGSCFFLGRTQELLYYLDRIGLEIPVSVDSLMGLEITKNSSNLEAFFDKEAKDLKVKGNHPFDFNGLYAVANDILLSATRPREPQ